MLKLKKSQFEILIFTFLIIVFIILSFRNFDIFQDKESIRLYILNFGIFAPISYIILQIIQVVVPFVPGGILTLSSGFLFGKYYGTLYSLVGMTIGSIFVFSISKKLGRPFIKKLVDHKLLKRVDSFMESYGEHALFLSRLMPFFPHDIISYAVGLTKIKRTKFILATILGFLPHSFIHNYIGDNIYRGKFDFTFYATISIFIIIGSLYLFREKLPIMKNKGGPDNDKRKS